MKNTTVLVRYALSELFSQGMSRVVVRVSMPKKVCSPCGRRDLSSWGFIGLGHMGEFSSIFSNCSQF